MRGYDRDRQRKEALLLLGKSLARRSNAMCEIFGTKGKALMPYEVPPVSGAPDLERTIFVCEECLLGLQGGVLNEHAWRALETSVWSEVSAVKVVAVRMLQRLDKEDVRWARDLLDMVYLTSEEQAWVDDV